MIWGCVFFCSRNLNDYFVSDFTYTFPQVVFFCMPGEFRTAGTGEAVEGRLLNDDIVFRMDDKNTLHLESSKKHDFWCKVNVEKLIKKKRHRQNDNVCIVTAMAETEYDGEFTGDVKTEIAVISEKELSKKYDICLEGICSKSTATGKYATLAQDIHRYKFTGDSFKKLLIIECYNEGECDSDYERERYLAGDD